MNIQKGKAPGLPPLPKAGLPPPVAHAHEPAVSLPQLRPLFWHTFVPPSDRTCLWDDVDVSVSGITDLIRNSESRLVSLFVYNQKKENTENLAPKKKDRRLSLSVNQASRYSTAVMPTQPSIIMHGRKIMKVLDDRKTQNLAIALRKFPDPEAVMDAILSVDTKILSGEQISLLLQEFPTAELCSEIERVENSHPEEEDHVFEWDRPEQYLLVLACVHNCREILTVWSFSVNHNIYRTNEDFDSTGVVLSGSNIRQQLTDFITACDAVCNATSLRVFLAILREIGNRMNFNTARGNAKGVSIESILQFDDLKSNSNHSVTNAMNSSTHQPTTTLFNVVVDLWLLKNPDNYNDLLTQLRTVRELRVPSLHEIELDIAKQTETQRKASDALKKYFEEVEDETEMAIADRLKSLSDPVIKVIKSNSDLLQKAKVAWAKCQSYFCIKSDSLLNKNSNDFFDHWKKVLKLVDKYSAPIHSK